MAFKELSSLAREMYLRQQIDQLRKIYSTAQKSLVAQLKQIDLTDFQMARAQILLKQVNEIISGLNVDAYKWAKTTMPKSYEQGIDLAAERLKALNITRFVSYDVQIHTSAVNVLIQDVSTELIMANDSMKKFFNRVISQSQQTLLQDTEINRQIAEGLIQGEARRTVSDKILQGLREKMGNEQFIIINGRNYKPSSYAELVARTRTKEASTLGTVNTALRYGMDLCQIDAHSGCCEYCQQYSGRVFSISGTDSDFPKLTEYPPWHPNCVCTLMPITKTNLQSRGYYNEMIKLSNAPSIKIPSFSRFEEVLSEL